MLTAVSVFRRKNTLSFHRTCMIYVFLLAMLYKGPSGSVVERPGILFWKKISAVFRCISHSFGIWYDYYSAFWNSTDTWQMRIFIVCADFNLSFRNIILVVTAADKFELNQCLPVSAQKLKSCYCSSVF